MKNSIALAGIQFLLILLFLYTGISKLLDPPSIETSLKYLGFPAPFYQFVSWALPLAEILLAILLILPRTFRPALFVCAFLLAGFTVYLSWMLISVADLPCSCGGVLQYMNWKQHIFFNLAFFTITLIGIFISGKDQDIIAIESLDVQQAKY